ncbi:hypothetical protein ES708_33373 [subsurface metagenome]
MINILVRDTVSCSLQGLKYVLCRVIFFTHINYQLVNAGLWLFMFPAPGFVPEEIVILWVLIKEFPEVFCKRIKRRAGIGVFLSNSIRIFFVVKKISQCIILFFDYRITGSKIIKWLHDRVLYIYYNNIHNSLKVYQKNTNLINSLLKCTSKSVFDFRTHI